MLLILLQCDGTTYRHLSAKLQLALRLHQRKEIDRQNCAQWPFAIWYEVETFGLFVSGAGIEKHHP